MQWLIDAIGRAFLFVVIGLGYLFGDEEGRAKMSWFQMLWLGATALGFFAGVIASNGELLQLGVAGFIGFFVGWTRPEKQ